MEVIDEEIQVKLQGLSQALNYNQTCRTIHTNILQIHYNCYALL